MRNARQGKLTVSDCLLGIATGKVLVSPHGEASQVKSGDALPRVIQSLDFTRDKEGIELTYTATALHPDVAADRAGELMTQTLAEFVRQFPQYAGDLIFTVAVLSHRRTVFVVRPWRAPPDIASAHGVAGDGTLRRGEVVSPDMPGPPPPYPATPNEISDITYRRYANGVQRDLQYHRRPACGPRSEPGPWRAVSDQIAYVGISGEVDRSEAMDARRSMTGVVIVTPPK